MDFALFFGEFVRREYGGKWEWKNNNILLKNISGKQQIGILPLVHLSNLWGNPLNNLPSLKWSVNTRAKKYVYYNKPVIKVFGKIENAVDVVINPTRGVAFNGEKNSDALLNPL